MRAKGLQVYELKPEDYTRWKTAVQPAIDNHKESLGKGFFEESIKAIKEIEAKLGV